MCRTARTASELAARHLLDRRDLCGSALFPRRHRGAAALSLRPHARARAYQGRQPSTSPGGPPPPASCRWGIGWAEAGGDLGRGPAVQRNRLAAHRARGAPRGQAAMSWSFAFDAALAVLVVALALWTLALRQSFGAVVAFAVYGLT